MGFGHVVERVVAEGVVGPLDTIDSEGEIVVATRRDWRSVDVLYNGLVGVVDVGTEVVGVHDLAGFIGYDDIDNLELVDLDCNDIGLLDTVVGVGYDGVEADGLAVAVVDE